MPWQGYLSIKATRPSLSRAGVRPTRPAAGRPTSTPPRRPADKGRRSADFRGDWLGSPTVRRGGCVRRRKRNGSSVPTSGGPSHAYRPWAAHWILDQFERYRVTDYEIIELNPDQIGAMKKD